MDHQPLAHQPPLGVAASWPWQQGSAGGGAPALQPAPQPRPQPPAASPIQPGRAARPLGRLESTAATKPAGAAGGQPHQQQGPLPTVASNNPLPAPANRCAWGRPV